MTIKLFIIALVFPVFSFAQDKIVSLTGDTIPCELIHIIQGDVTIVPDGTEKETVISLGMLSSYQWLGKWITLREGKVVGSVAATGADDYDMELALKYTGDALRKSGTSLAVGGAFLLFGGGLFTAANIVANQGSINADGIMAMSTIGGACILVGGAAILSATVPLDRAGKRLKRVKMSVGGIPVGK